MDEYKRQTVAEYDAHATGFARRFKNAMTRFDRPEFARFLELIPGKHVLDVGCGSGEHAHFFKERGCTVIGIDLSQAFVDMSRAKGVDARVMDMEEMHFPPKTFDGVWCAASLLHVPKHRMAHVSDSLANVLKDDGILYVNVKEGKGEGMVSDETNTNRFFSYWTQEEIMALLDERFDFLEGRKAVATHTWLVLFFKKR